MTTTLDPFAVQHAALLSALDARPEGGWSLSDLALQVGRDPSNVRKTVSKLEDDGLAAFNSLTHGLTDAGRAQLAAIGRATGDADGSAGDPGILFLTHDRLTPNPDNDRRDWDSAEAKADLESLAADIRDRGVILQNLTVRHGGDGQPYIINGGERRWRAVGLLIARGEWPAERPLPCRLLDMDDLGLRLAALSENLQRRDLNPIEKARAFDALAGLLVEQGTDERKVNGEIAARLSVTPEHVQQHRRFLQLDPADQERMALPADDARRLSVSDARRKLARKDEQVQAFSWDRLTDDRKLVLAELAHAARTGSTYLGGTFAVAPEARQDAFAQTLKAEGLLYLSDEPGWTAPSVGHYRASINGWPVQSAVRAAVPDIADAKEPEARADALRRFQCGLGVTPPDGALYVTPWLNGPFELTPEGQAIVEEIAERTRAAEEAAARRREEEAARAVRWAEARRRHLQALEAARTAPPTDLVALTRETAAGVDQPLPWRATESGTLLDAEGQEVVDLAGWNTNDRDVALVQLIALSVNTAAGLPTPPLLTEDDEDKGEDAEASDAEDHSEGVA